MPADNEFIPAIAFAMLAQLERLELVSRKIFRGRMKGERRRANAKGKASSSPTSAIMYRATIYGMSIGISMPGSKNSF